MTNERDDEQNHSREPQALAAGPAATEVRQEVGGSVRRPAAAAIPRDARARNSGRALAWLALLLALGAAGAAGVATWYLRFAPLAVEGRLTELERRLDAAEEAGRRERNAQAQALSAYAARIESDLKDLLKQDLAAAVPRVTPPVAAGERAAPAPRDWQLAEARYLLRLANHRVRLEGDAGAALTLLESADDVLRRLDDPGLIAVRAQIAEERLALEQLPAADAEGLFLEIEALKRALDRLPLRVPTLPPAEPDDQPPEDLWAALRSEFAGMLRFRRFDGAVRPLLAPEEAVYLELNLRLMLERAQLAALRHEQAIYADSIAAASEWVERYLDVSSVEVHAVRSGLEALARVQVALPLPDVSGSLKALDAVGAGIPEMSPGSD